MCELKPVSVEEFSVAICPALFWANGNDKGQGEGCLAEGVLAFVIVEGDFGEFWIECFDGFIKRRIPVNGWDVCGKSLLGTVNEMAQPLVCWPKFAVDIIAVTFVGLYKVKGWCAECGEGVENFSGGLGAGQANDDLDIVYGLLGVCPRKLERQFICVDGREGATTWWAIDDACVKRIAHLALEHV